MGLVQRLTRFTLSHWKTRADWIQSGPRSSSAIALTFDDGPHPEQTPRLLDQLAAHNIRATFFVIGRQALKHPQLVRRIHAEGHQIGNHTWFHHEPGRLRPLALQAEVRECRQLIQDLTGIRVSLFGPPKGELTWAKIRALWQQQQTIALWNIDPKDFAIASAEEMQHWASRYAPRGGDIVLMHDNHPWAATAIPQLAKSAREAELSFTTLEAWVGPPKPAAAGQIIPADRSPFDSPVHPAELVSARIPADRSLASLASITGERVDAVPLSSPGMERQPHLLEAPAC